MQVIKEDLRPDLDTLIPAWSSESEDPSDGKVGRTLTWMPATWRDQDPFPRLRVDPAILSAEDPMRGANLPRRAPPMISCGTRRISLHWTTPSSR